MEKITPLYREMVVLGDRSVGKSSFLRYIATEKFSDVSGLSDGPFYNERWLVEMRLDGHSIELASWEAEVEGDDNHLRFLRYANAAVIMMALAIDDIVSLQNVANRWHAELLHFCNSPTPPIILVGCKSDLRRKKIREVNASGGIRELVTKEQGHALASRIGAVSYLEFSSKTGEGKEEITELIFRTAISWTPSVKPKEQRGCLIM